MIPFSQSNILPQHCIQLNALLALHNDGEPAKIEFNAQTAQHTVGGKVIKSFENFEALSLQDLEILNKAKNSQDGKPHFLVYGDHVISFNDVAINEISSPVAFAFHNFVTFHNAEDAKEALKLARKLQYAQDSADGVVKIKMFKEHPDAMPPRVAYSGTSAAFDLASVEDIVIPAFTDAVVPVGLRLSIPDSEPYYMTIHMRSSLGFKKGIQNHIGIVDSGYCGDFGVKVFNRTAFPLSINKGEYFAQVLVHKKPKFKFEMLQEEEWQDYVQTQERGEGGFGSSGKN